MAMFVLSLVYLLFIALSCAKAPLYSTIHCAAVTLQFPCCVTKMVLSYLMLSYIYMNDLHRINALTKVCV